MGESAIDTEFFAGFLDDYFAECEEHLIVARRALLSLEASVNRPQADRALLDELFRSFHSLKGISGMVGAREAERLAHELESYLRAMRQGETTLTPEGMDVLITGVRMLGDVVSAHRFQSAPPDITPILERLAEISSQKTPPSGQIALAKAVAAQTLQNGLSVEEFSRLEAAR